MPTAGRATLAAVATALLLAACTDRGAPAAVAIVDGAPAVAWKFCDRERGIGAITVARDADDQRAVWRTTIRPGATALTTVPVAAEIEGYDVETSADWPLRPDQKYTVTDSVDAQDASVPAAALLRAWGPRHRRGLVRRRKWAARAFGRDLVPVVAGRGTGVRLTRLCAASRRRPVAPHPPRRGQDRSAGRPCRPRPLLCRPVRPRPS
jgi:hypothetical protein